MSAPTRRRVPRRVSVRTLPSLPAGFEPRTLIRRTLEVIALLIVLGLVALLAPGLGEVRDRFEHANVWWIALGVVLELFSCLSYVLMFRPIFCRSMSWGTSSRIAWSELGVGSIVPASGAAGLALGGWALVQRGMSVDRVARRSVAFFVIRSAVNFVAVAVLGIVMAVGLIGPHVSPLLTALPAALSILVIVGVLLLPRLGPGERPREDASRTRRWISAARASVIHGVHEAVEVLRHPDPLVFVGAIGYWVWDNAVLWATYRAFGGHVAVSIILMGYLIGQLGGALPIPGGVGGIDGGLIGTLVLFGAPAAVTTAAVLAYRVILFWLPLIGGGIGFYLLRRDLQHNGDRMFEGSRPETPAGCAGVPR